jgi:hypothetical protein
VKKLLCSLTVAGLLLGLGASEVSAAVIRYYYGPGPVVQAVTVVPRGVFGPRAVYVAPWAYYPAPAYVAPAPVYMAPAPTYMAPAPTYMAPAPAYVAPTPAYVAPTPAPAW